jgi:hypothetical protein
MALLVLVFLTSQSLAQAQAAGAPEKVFLLDAADTVEENDKDLKGGLLIREIARQAVLIAARDGLGLATRDSVLGEFDAAQNPPGLFHIKARARRLELHITLDRGPPAERKIVWEKTISFGEPKGMEYMTLITELEKLSRTDVVVVLKQVGFEGSHAPPPSKASVPEEIEKHLNELNVIGQVAALRQLHARLQSAGESPALLGGLVRGYANLGVLTQHHWSVAHKAFKARALLYAERMVAKAPASPATHWHRAYARALAGMPVRALESSGGGGKAPDGGKNQERSGRDAGMDQRFEGILPM